MSTTEKKLAFHRRTAAGAQAWGTEIAVAALDGLPYDSESLPKAVDLLDDQGPDLSKQLTAYPGNFTKNEGTTEHKARFLSFGDVLACIFGKDTATLADVTAYTHKLEILRGSDMLNKFGTLALDENTDGHGINVWPSAKPRGFMLEGDAASGAPLKLTLDWMVNYLLAGSSSSVNTATELGNVTYRSRVLPIMPYMGVWRILKVTGAEASLGASHIIRPSKFSIGVKRNLAAQFTTDDGTGGNNAQGSFEPEHAGYDEFTLSMTLNKQDSGTKAFFDAVAALATDTIGQWKADVTFTSPQTITGSTSKYSQIFRWPNLAITPESAAKIANPHLNEVTLAFKVLGVTSAPAGMTVTNEMEAVLQDDVSTDYDA